jgi:hypothetical protein
VETVLVGVMVVVMFVVEYMTSTDGLDVETALEVGVVETTLDIIEVEGVTGVFGTTLSVVEMMGVVVVEAGVSEEDLEDMSVVITGSELPSGEPEGRRLSRRLLRRPVSNEGEAEAEAEVSPEVVFSVGSGTSTSQQCAHGDDAASQSQEQCNVVQSP